MPNTSHGKQSEKTYHVGVNTDTEPEVLKTGFALRLRNMRATVKGTVSAIKKILGEITKWGNVDNRYFGGTGAAFSNSYECIGSTVVNRHVVEFWADKLNVTPGLPFVRIDGWVVLMAQSLQKFPITVANPIQTHKNDSCVGGEVFGTDNNMPPFVFNVEDMLMNAGVNPATNLLDVSNFPPTQKYFNQFDIVKFTVQPQRPIDIAVFIGFVTAGTQPDVVGRVETHGTGGLNVGEYQYTFNYLTGAGDTTQFVENTPNIPLPKGWAIYGTHYPTAKTYGGVAGAVPALGIHIRFRVNNVNNFTEIQVKRTSYIAGAPSGTAGVEELLPPIAIAPGEVSIVDFYDYDNATGVVPATPAETSDNMAVIETAKAIRYYNSRLDLMNIKYASRNMDGQLGFDVSPTGGKEMVPIQYAMGVNGHGDIWNQVYKKNYMGGERFGFAIVGYDTEASRSFATPIASAFDNFQMPDRRDELSGDSLTFSSYYQSPSLYLNTDYTKAVNSNSTPSVTQTFEAFDLVGAVNKNSSYTLNISDAFNGGVAAVLTPIGDSDGSITGFDYHINDKVGAGQHAYNPKGFGQNYYSKGMSLVGLNKYPTWMQAFSVVRTLPAKRVIAQGLGFYKINTGPPPTTSPTVNYPCTKEQNRIWWDSPDTSTGLLNMGDIATNYLRYQAQVVSPLGMFSEVYGYASDVPSIIDMVCYGKIIREVTGNEINPDEGLGITYSANGVQDGVNQYVSWNSWRNLNATTPTTNPVTPNQKFYFTNIVASDGVGSQHRQRPASLELSANIYANKVISISHEFQDTDVRNWHEPLYVTNIIDDTQNIVNSIVTEYYETGTYIKITSIIGKGDGTTTNFILVDERWEDCIPALDSGLPTTITNQDRYVYIVDSLGNEQVWLNVTFKSSGDITTIKNDIQANGFYLSTRPDGTTANVTGIYTSFVNGRTHTLSFNQTDNLGSAFIPQAGESIVVKYDHNAPISVGGGDSFVGEFGYCPIDTHFNASGDQDTAQDEFILNTPLPYERFYVNANVIQTYIAHTRTAPVGPSRITTTAAYCQNVRQLIVQGVVESRQNTLLFYGDRFPNQNYRYHPTQWDTNYSPGTTQFNINNNIVALVYGIPSYNTESSLWGFGGFDFRPQFNNDYYKDPFNLVFDSHPKVGYVEQNSFCSRIIWSAQRPINKTGAAGILTFPPLNFYDMGDETGEIKFAWDALSSSGSNLYAFTENGIALILTQKQLLYNLSGQGLGTMGNSNADVVQEVMWISKVTGMNDEMWRSKGEWDNKLFFTNNNSSYEFSNNKLSDIGRKDFHRRLFGNFLTNLLSGFGTDVTGVYHTLHNEYWVQIRQRRKAWKGASYINVPPFTTTTNNYSVAAGDVIEVYFSVPGNISIRLPDMFLNTLTFINTSSSYSITIASYGGTILQVMGTGAYTFTGQNFGNVSVTPGIVSEFKGLLSYSTENEAWFDTFDYDFNRYVSFDNITYGSKQASTYLLNSGLQINGTDIVGEVTGACNDVEAAAKEFIRFRANSDNKPSVISFYKTVAQLEANTPICVLDTTTNIYALKIRQGYEQYVPRESSGNNLRVQGRLLIFKISHFRTAEEFKLISTGIEYKILK